MGGNALSVPTTRLGKRQYEDVCADVVGKLNSVLPGRRISVIEAYAEKPDFGDLDVLIEGGAGYDPLEVAKALEAVEVVRNGDVTSIGVNLGGEVFQVDLIKIAPDSFEFAKHYFAFNDLGNLLGRVAHKAGFKLGHLGLIYVMRQDGKSSQVIDELVVTHDWHAALSFLGFDANRYAQGFESLVEIFEFAVSSRYCNKDIYLLENRNAVSRIRDRKRKTYTSFLLWLDSDASTAVHRFDWDDKAVVRTDFLNRAFLKFPVFKSHYDAAFLRWERDQQIRLKFNGEMVSKITGLVGRELGIFIKDFKGEFRDDDVFKEWVVVADQKEIEHRVRVAGRVLKQVSA